MSTPEVGQPLGNAAGALLGDCSGVAEHVDATLQDLEELLAQSRRFSTW